MRLNKKAAMNGWVIALLVVGVLYVANPNIFTNLFGGAAPATPATDAPTTPLPAPACLSTTAPVVYLAAQDSINTANSPSPNYLLFIDGQESTDVSSPFDVQVQKDSLFLVNQTGTYYNKKYTVPGFCASQDNKVVKLDRFGTITFTLINDIGETGKPATLGADVERTMKIKAQIANDRVFNNREVGENIKVCMDYNTSQIDKVTSVKPTGGDNPTFSVPQKYVGTMEECYTTEKSSLFDNEEYDFFFLVDTDNSNNPDQNVNVTFVDSDYFLGEKARDIRSGVETDFNYVDVGGADLSFRLNIS